MPCIIKQYEQYSLSREEELYFLSIHQGDVITSNLTANLERDSKAMLPYSYGIHQFFIYCHGCVNGIVCLSFIHNRSPKIRKCALALWNPATRDFKTIAYPYVPGLHFGPHFLILAFGYDVQSNDFKILGMTAIQIPGEDKSISYHAIYSLNTNSWKELQIPLANLRRVPNATTDGSFNGVHYWTTYFSCLPMPVSNFEIVSFNFTSEAFRVSDAPQEAVTLALKGNSSYQAMIVMYKEQLGLVISHEVKEVAVYNSDIWVVTQFDDCGVPLSWQHLFTIQGSSDQLDLRVDTVLINGDLLLNCASREDKIDLCDAPPRYSYHYNPLRALWNPATRDVKTIAYPYVLGLHFGCHFGILAFGYDAQSNDFKILGTTAIQIPGEDKSISYHAIYSLNTNSWKELQIPLANLRHVPNATTDGSLNGVHYWITYFSCLPMPVSNFEIVAFNFTSEAFRVSDAPQEAATLALKGNSSYQAMIVMYKEQLALVISHEVKEVAVYNSDIWVVTQFDDCGVPLSWQHLFTIQGSSNQLELQVDTVLIDGDLLLNCASREDKIDLCDAPPRYSYHYNLSRGEFKKFQIGLWPCFRYVESLFPVSRRLLQA
ncbi:hypothetical protein RDABS01_023075 [Bienertia sinuspersici]